MENGIELEVAVASGVTLAKSALTKTGKVLGIISEAVSNTAVNTLAEVASTVVPGKSLITFKYYLAAAKAVKETKEAANAAKGCARNNFGISNKLKSSSFTPTFNEIRSFSVKSAFDGKLYPKDKLTPLVKYLEKRGVNVYGTEGAPRFLARKNGASDIYLPEQPNSITS